MTAANEPVGGLWAWTEGKLFSLIFSAENRQLDHVTWFQQIGLADYGPEFDRILRGRMMWDWVYEHYVLSFYGVKMLPNQVYKLVNDTFNKAGHDVIERPALDRWIL